MDGKRNERCNIGTTQAHSSVQLSICVYDERILQGLLVDLTGANTNSLADIEHEDLAVADFSGGG